jgi:hypothetical protein
MKIYMCRLLFGMACALIACGVNADWQYTRWGMTAAEIVAASKGAARTDPYGVAFPPPPGATLLAVGNTEIAGFTLSVAFLANRSPTMLDLVIVTYYGAATPEPCQRILQALQAELGAGSTLSGFEKNHAVHWVNQRQRNDHVLFSALPEKPNGCYIWYGPAEADSSVASEASFTLVCRFRRSKNGVATPPDKNFIVDPVAGTLNGDPANISEGSVTQTYINASNEKTTIEINRYTGMLTASTTKMGIFLVGECFKPNERKF